jgi:hypothetical protein
MRKNPGDLQIRPHLQLGEANVHPIEVSSDVTAEEEASFSDLPVLSRQPA